MGVTLLLLYRNWNREKVLPIIYGVLGYIEMFLNFFLIMVLHSEQNMSGLIVITLHVK